ncbi:type IV secretion system DNA-binding domain-containing protein [Glycomyces sp. MUSA5-2]|uniref:type IV secretion system DNA-binding domain-containing protein n=1 Tax=Glycomyces sp. MUSA5-2 TaxID=2053002 RepID=UPI0030095D4D
MTAKQEQSIAGARFGLRAGTQAATGLVAAETGGDVVRGLIEAGTSNRAGDRTVVQIVARPASPRRVARARRALTPHSGSLGAQVLDLFTPGKPAPRAHRAPEGPWAGEERKRLAARLGSGALWSVGVRYALAVEAAPATAAARSGQVGAAVGAMLGPAWRRRRCRRAGALVDGWASAAGPLMSADELAALAHVPADAVVPALERAGARPIAPVAAVPSGGRATKPLGVALVGGRKIAIPVADARSHLHVIGSTGSGKSTLLLRMILADIRARRAIILVDPKGDLVNDVLDRLDPAQVAGRLVLIDPDQAAAAHRGLPPIVHTEDTELAIDHLVGICANIFVRHWGPRADDVLRQSLRTQVLLGSHDYSGLESLPILLTDSALRAPLVTSIPEGEKILTGFWKWFDSLPAGVQSQAVGPVVARLRTILGRPFVAATIGNPAQERCIDLPAALDGGGIILARLPKGQLGEDTAKLMGSLLVARTWQTVTARQQQAEHRRKDVALYVDEAQNFLQLPESIDDMLAEARALRLGMVLAHQHLGQLGRDLESAVSANCRTKVVFNVAPEDARRLARHTAPLVNEHDLAHQGAFTAACRPVIGSEVRPAFSLRTLPAPEPIGQARTVRASAAAFPAFTFKEEAP